MFTFGALSFVAPVALLAMALLPVIWWFLRVIPPAPKRVRFPAIRLIMGLTNPEESSAKTPLWLTLLRLALVAFIIVGAAHPVLNAGNQLPAGGPLVLVIDDGWAAAKNWAARRDAAGNLIDRAERDARPVFVVTTAPGNGRARALQSLMSADDARQIIRALNPKPWPVDREAAISVINEIGANKGAADANVQWLSNGLDEGSAAEFAAALRKLGPLTILAEPPGGLPSILLPPSSERDGLILHARRAPGSVQASLGLRLRDEQGGVLASKKLSFKPGATEGTLKLPLPAEIRNRVTRIEIEGGNHAGGMILVDERWRRRPVGIATDATRRVDQPLLDDIYYLDRALDPFTEVRLGSITELLRRELALLVLADPERLSGTERRLVENWMTGGGIVLRFAGPRLSDGIHRLLPVRLRQGDRELGGALSWSKPASLAPFPPNSPFAGLVVPGDVKIRRQVLAQPSVDLPDKTWARLSDGTPIVTAEKRGQGWLVFVHTTASPNWSDLPLSGLFVGMLQNLVQMSRGVSSGADNRLLAPIQTVDGFGALSAAGTGARAIRANQFATELPGPEHPPGFYGDKISRRAFNLAPKLAEMEPMASISGAQMGTYQTTRERDLRGGLLAAALLLALADIIASFALRGFFGARRAVAGALILAALTLAGGPAHAQSKAPPISAFAGALKVRIAYVPSGDRRIDDVSRAGLIGLA
ncbi:MAG: BatA domain-containing protein, partial [Rhodospirillales bacterium]|nr:BatA domain-containing protein [Rhodospirillales bacterium]